MKTLASADCLTAYAARDIQMPPVSSLTARPVIAPLHDEASSFKCGDRLSMSGQQEDGHCTRAPFTQKKRSRIMRNSLLMGKMLFAALGLVTVFAASGSSVRADPGCSGTTFAPGLTCSQEDCNPWCATGCTAAASGHTQNEQGCWCKCNDPIDGK
jgi:hypothetical protein